MPLVGVLLGAGLGGAIESSADYAAGVLLVILGGYTLWPCDESAEVEAAARLAHTHGIALIGLGISVSMDELAIGFSVGLLRISIAAAVVVIALQAFLVTQIGVRIGSRVGEEIREGAEKLARLALVILGVFFLAIRVL